MADTFTLKPDTERLLLERARELGRDPVELLVEVVTKELDALDADPERMAAFVARLKARPSGG